MVHYFDQRLVDQIQEDLEDCLLAVVYAFDVFPRVPFGFCIFFPLANGSTPTVNIEKNILDIVLIYLGVISKLTFFNIINLKIVIYTVLTLELAIPYMSPSTFLAYATRLCILRSSMADGSGDGKIACTLKSKRLVEF